MYAPVRTHALACACSWHTRMRWNVLSTWRLGLCAPVHPHVSMRFCASESMHGCTLAQMPCMSSLVLPQCVMASLHLLGFQGQRSARHGMRMPCHFGAGGAAPLPCASVLCRLSGRAAHTCHGCMHSIGTSLTASTPAAQPRNRTFIPEHMRTRAHTHIHAQACFLFPSVAQSGVRALAPQHAGEQQLPGAVAGAVDAQQARGCSDLCGGEGPGYGGRPARRLVPAVQRAHRCRQVSALEAAAVPDAGLLPPGARACRPLAQGEGGGGRVRPQCQGLWWCKGGLIPLRSFITTTIHIRGRVTSVRPSRVRKGVRCARARGWGRVCHASTQPEHTSSSGPQAWLCVQLCGAGGPAAAKKADCD